MEWDATLEASTVVEWLSKDTVVTHQVHKRVWPATQRDSLFWSTIRHCPSEDDEGPDYWIVANCSTEHNQCPVCILPPQLLVYCHCIDYASKCTFIIMHIFS